MRTALAWSPSARTSRGASALVGFATLAVASIVTGACSSGDSSPALDGGPSNGDATTDAGEITLFPVEDFARKMAEGICSNVGPCCRDEGLFFDDLTCLAYGNNALASAVESRYTALNGAVIYDAKAAAACLKSYVSILRTCHKHEFLGRLVDRVRSSSGPPFEPECDRIFTGTTAVGAPCTDGAECVVNAACTTIMGNPSNKVCTEIPPPIVAPRALAGESCTRTCGPPEWNTPVCGTVVSDGGTPPEIPPRWCFLEDGVFCDAQWTCRPLAALGEPCTAKGCRPEGYCEQGVCTARRATGTCGEGFEGCSAGSYCEPMLGCMPRKKAGDACGGGDCPEGMICRTSVTCGNNCASTCRTPTVVTLDLCAGTL